jgi:hypothetical protein
MIVFKFFPTSIMLITKFKCDASMMELYVKKLIGHCMSTFNESGIHYRNAICFETRKFFHFVI